MKMRNKGKVHPSPSSNRDNNALSVLNLLPAAILAIASVLSLEDREVLAYMVTRSMKPTTNPSDFSKKNSKKFVTHKPPVFDCECFDCYTCYWFKWDSSPNRELIHQAIEAFEEYLSNNEHSKKNRNKKKLKSFRRNGNLLPEVDDDFVHVLAENADVSSENSVENEAEEVEVKETVGEVVAPLPETTVMVRGTAVNGGHKGLARKVLPDVLGLFNSRLWNLWSPNV